MTTQIRLLLALLPLAGYFALLGMLHAGRRPKIVAGPADFGCLALGLGGLIAFGPLGGLIVDTVFPRPNLPAWLAMASLVGLLAMMGASRARTRFVVYNVSGQALTDAIGRVMEAIAGPVTATLHGYEDAKGRRGVTVEIGPILGWGIVSAHGEAPEALIDAVRSALKARLDTPRRIRSSLVALWFALAGVTLAVLFIATTLMTRDEVRAAVRKIGG